MATSEAQHGRATGRVTETRFSLLEQEVIGIKNDVGQLRDEIRAYFNRSSLRSVWPMVVGIAGFMYFILSQTITNQTSVLGRDVTEIKSKFSMIDEIPTIIAQNAESKRDREDKGQVQMKMLEVQTLLLKDLAKEQSHRVAKNYEIETQLRAHENDMNMTRKWNNTFFALLWQKVYGERFPEFQIYPTISERSGPEEIQ